MRVLLATAVAVANAIAFAAVRPAVGDLQAALARQSAAEHGVGLGYWFSWYSGGTAPGGYSLVVPALSALVGAVALAAVATAAVTPLTWWALAGARWRLEATWVATLAVGVSLWSGRVPFALGCAVGVLALGALLHRRRVLAALAALAAGAVTPLASAFLLGVLVVLALTDRRRRRDAALLAVVAALPPLVVALWFGTPGPQPYPWGMSLKAALAALVMVLARPRRPVAVLAVLSALGSPLLAAVDNGVGSNAVRFVYVCLPAAVLATARARRLTALAAVTPALALSVVTLVGDLGYAARPPASASYYRALVAETDRLPDLDQYRLQVVQDTRFHTAARVLLGHAALAGGYETQSAGRYDAVLSEHGLDATRYRGFLDDNAVGYVALDTGTRAGSPEYRLVARGLPYLTRVWTGPHWTLYRVRDAARIAPAPSRVVTSEQGRLAIGVPCACRVPLRLRYSDFLVASGRARVRDEHGWAVLVTSVAGTITLSGRVFFNGPP